MKNVGRRTHICHKGCLFSLSISPNLQLLHCIYYFSVVLHFILDELQEISGIHVLKSKEFAVEAAACKTNVRKLKDDEEEGTQNRCNELGGAHRRAPRGADASVALD